MHKAHMQTARTSSKRSATQLPSPSTPSSQELPPKIARLRLEHHNNGEDECLSDPCPEESDYALSSRESTPPTSLPPSDCDSLSDTDDLYAEPFGFGSLSTRIRQSREEESQAPWPVTRQCHHHWQPDGYASPSIEPSVWPEDRALSVANRADELHLQTLPPEIRHQIYLYLDDLILGRPLIYCLSTFPEKKQPTIAAVSRLIRSEVRALFYSYNTWVIKLEFKMMYDSFQTWICELGDNASSLRLIQIAVRGSLFKPRTSHQGTNGAVVQGMNGNLTLVQAVEAYSPPDGDASFSIDLSEKWAGGKVEVMRNDGTKEAGEKARMFLGGLAAGLWEKRRVGTLNGQDWVTAVDQFLDFVGWR